MSKKDFYTILKFLAAKLSVLKIKTQNIKPLIIFEIHVFY